MSAIKITPADRWFSLCVRKRANFSCERCHTGHAHNSPGLHCAHVFSRGSWSVRFDPKNAVALCMGCHLYFTGRPLEFKAWIAERMGDGDLEDLGIRAREPGRAAKRRKKEIAAHYKAEFDRMPLGGLFLGWASE